VPLHIHLIENDWLAGQQRIVATLSVSGGQYDIQSADPAKWVSALQLSQLGGSYVRPEDEERLLAGIFKRVQGDYLFCTEPHEARECDFPPVTALQSPQAPVHHSKRPAAAV
jgi:hypothetical protein